MPETCALEAAKDAEKTKKSITRWVSSPVGHPAYKRRCDGHPDQLRRTSVQAKRLLSAGPATRSSNNQLGVGMLNLLALESLFARGHRANLGLAPSGRCDCRMPRPYLKTI